MPELRRLDHATMRPDRLSHPGTSLVLRLGLKTKGSATVICRSSASVRASPDSPQ